MNENPLEALYNNVGAEFDLGTYEEFYTKMQDPESLASFYNNVGAEFDLGDYDSFTSKINTSYGAETQREINVDSQGAQMSVEEKEELGFSASGVRSSRNFVMNTLPSMVLDLVALSHRTGMDVIEGLVPDQYESIESVGGKKIDWDWMEDMKTISEMSATGVQTKSQEIKKAADYEGVATTLSDIYNPETGDFKPERIGSFGGYALGQTLPQVGLMYATGGASTMPMGIAEAWGAQIDAYEEQGLSPQEVFAGDKDKVIEAWGEGIAIGMLDKFGFDKLKGGKESIKGFKDIIKQSTVASVSELVTEMGQETIGAIGGDLATREDNTLPEMWNAVEDKVTDLKGFWYDRVLTAGAMGFLGSGTTSTVTSSYEAIKNKLSTVAEKDIENILSNVGLINKEVTEYKDVTETSVEETAQEDIIDKISNEEEVIEEQPVKEVVNEFDAIANEINNATPDKVSTEKKNGKAVEGSKVADEITPSKKKNGAKADTKEEVVTEDKPVKTKKVEKKSKSSKEKTVIQEPAKVSPTKPVVQKEKVSKTEPTKSKPVINKETKKEDTKKIETAAKEKEAERVQRETEQAESLAKAKKETEDANFNKVEFQNRAHKIEVGAQGRQVKIDRLNKLRDEATTKGVVNAIPAIDKRINALQDSLDETNDAAVNKAAKKAKKEEVVVEKDAPIREDGVYKGESENGAQIFENKKGDRFVVKNGKKSTPVSERNKYTKEELDVRAKVRSANNRKVEAYKKKMLNVWERIHGYKAKIKTTKDQGTKGNYEAALISTEKEAKALTDELNTWRNKPTTPEGFEGIISFKDKKKVTDAIAEAKKAAVATQVKSLPRAKKSGKVKETLSGKDRSPMMESEKKRIEKAEDEAGIFISELDKKNEITNKGIAKADALKGRLTDKYKKKIDAATKRANDRGAQAEIDKLENQIIDGDEFIIDDDTWEVEPSISESENLEDWLYDQTEGKDDMQFKNAKKVESPKSIWEVWKKAYGFEALKSKHPLQDLSIKLLEKVNKIRKDNGLGTIDFYIADEINYGNGTASGIHFMTSKNKNGKQIVVIATEGFQRGETPAHELMHAWHGIQKNTLIDINGNEFLYGAKFESELLELQKIAATELRKLNGLYQRNRLTEEQTRAMYMLDMKFGIDNILEGKGSILNNEKEFLAYGLTDSTFATVLNMLSAGKKSTTQGKTVFAKIVEAVLSIADAMGIKINRESVLGNMLESVEKADSKYKYDAITVDVVMPDSKIEHIDYHKKNSDTRYDILASAVSERASNIREARAVIKAINIKLDKGKKVTKEERTKLLKMVAKGTDKKASKEVIKEIVSTTDPKNFIAKGSKGKNIKGKNAHEDAIALVSKIHDALRKKQTPDSIKAAEATIKEVEEALIEGNYITQEQEDSATITRAVLAEGLTLAEVESLQKEVDDILAEGKEARKIKKEHKANQRKLLKERGLDEMPWIKDGEITDSEYENAKKQLTPQKEDKIWTSFSKKLKSTFNNWGLNTESFHSLMDLIGGKEEGAAAMNTFFNKTFGTKATKAKVDKSTMIAKWNDKVLDKFSEITGTKKGTKGFDKGMTEFTDESIEVDYYISEGHKEAGKKATKKLSLNQISNIWMWMQQEGTEANMKTHGFGTDFRNQINDQMEANPKAKELAEWMLNDFYKEMYTPINEVYRERAGHDLPMTQFYSPLVYDYMTQAKEQGVGMDRAFHPVASTLRSMVLSRQSNTQKLDFSTGMLENASRHIENSAHFVTYDSFVSELRSFFGDNEVKKALEMKFGGRINKVLDMYMESFSNENALRSQVHNTLDKFRANLSTVFLGANPTIYAKQLISAVAYSAYMPEGSKSWKSMQAAALVPRSEMNQAKDYWIDKIKKHPVFRERVAKGQRSLGESHRSLMNNMMFGVAINQTKLAKAQDFSMGLVRAGDMGAITQGGWANAEALYQKNIGNGMSKQAAKEAAMEKFVANTLMAQQSVDVADLSAIQLDNSAISKLFTTFTTTVMQYNRNSRAARRALIRNKMGSKNQQRAGYQLLMFRLVLPMMFAVVSQMGQFAFAEDDEEREKLLSRILYAPLQSMLTGNHIVGGIADTALRKVMLGESFGSYGGLVTSASGLIESTLSSIVKMGSGKQPTEKEFIKILDTIGMLTNGLPLGNAYELGSGAYKASTGEGDWRNALGWSDYSLGKSGQTKKKKTVTPPRSPSRRILNRRVNRRR